MTPADAKLLADIRRWAMRLGSCGRKERAADLRALADFAVESDADREARRPPSDTAPPSRRSTRTGTRRKVARARTGTTDLAPRTATSAASGAAGRSVS